MGLIKQPPRDERITTEQRRNERDCESLCLQLDDPNPTARRWAARDLSDCPEASAALVSRLSHEPDSSVREIILTTLAQFRDPVALAGLIDCLSSEDAPMRNQAIEVMKQLPEEIAPLMQQLLANPNPDVRILALNILESLRHPQVEQWLLEVIASDHNVNVCASALDLLVEVGSNASVEPLHHLKARYADEPYIQFAVDLALKRILED